MQYTPFSMTRDINGYNGFGLPFSINQYSATLAQNTDTTLTVPSYANNYIAIFAYQEASTVWVAKNNTAGVPAGSTFAATKSQLMPAAHYVAAGDVLHFFTADTSAVVSVMLYALPLTY